MRRADDKRRPRRTWPQRLILTFNSLLVVGCLAAAVGLAVARREIHNVPVVALDALVAADTPGEPRNYLIIGTDSARRLEEDDYVRRGRGGLGTLADVIMILRVVPDQEQAYLLSIPRDTYLETAPNGTRQRINATIRDGPNDLIETIRDQFGVEINNYLEIDFRGFKDMVDVFGGIPVYMETPVRDRETGLNIEQTGCVQLDAIQALAYARSRHFQYRDEDGDWRTDPSGDFGRIRRQQEFLKLAAQRAIDQGIRNPTKALDVLGIVQQSILIDNSLEPGELLEVLERFRSFNPEELQTFSLPTRSLSLGGAAYQEVVEDEAEPILDVFRGVTAASGSAPATPADVQVSVLNGSDVDGQAMETAEALEEHGFTRHDDPDTATVSLDQTLIRYATGSRESAVLLARWVNPVPILEEDPDLSPGEVVLITGRDLLGVRDGALPDDLLPEGVLDPPTTTSTTTTTILPPDTEVTGGNEGDPDTTTTTEVGIVPTSSNGECG